MSRVGRLLRGVIPRRRPHGPGMFLGALVAAILIVGGWVVLNGPVGDFRTVDLTGYDRADHDEIEALVADAVSRGNMISIPDDEVRKAARRSPWVDDVAFRRRFPSTLEVSVLPARPVAVAVPPKGKSVLVSNRGLILGPAGKGQKLPRIRLGRAAPQVGERLPRASRAAWRFIRASEGTAVYPRLRGLRLADGELVGHLQEGPDLRIGVPEQLRAKALSLNAVYGSLEPERRREIAYVNVTVPDRPAIGEPITAETELAADVGPTTDAPTPESPSDSGVAEPSPAPAPEASPESSSVPEPEPTPPATPVSAPAPEAAADAISPALPGGLDSSSAPPPPGAAG